MGKIKKHPPVQLFMAVTFNAQAIDESVVLQEIEKQFGNAELKSERYDFDAFTNYYENEMGKGLVKRFISFYKLIDPEDLPDIKIKTNALEKKLSGNDERRVVNIDPGYLNLSKVVLATTKDYSHRLYLGKGIFGDLHLVFINKTFQTQPWTYPDYKQPLSIAFFLKLREAYRNKLGEFLEFNLKPERI